MKYVAPTTVETAFNCPHCGSLTTQAWFELFAKERVGANLLPIIIDQEELGDWKFENVENLDERKELVDWAKRLAQGVPFLERADNDEWANLTLWNVSAAKCFNCKEFSIWLHGRMLYPTQGTAPEANPDMPVEIRQDYEEASSILDRSPRGAAALIRLAIQKLCKSLGQPGQNLNADIGALVKAGLSIRVQQALDAVRVIGNNAVHPGQLDLRDDRATAETLFKLLNIIVEKMISDDVTP